MTCALLFPRDAAQDCERHELSQGRLHQVAVLVERRQQICSLIIDDTDRRYCVLKTDSPAHLMCVGVTCPAPGNAGSQPTLLSTDP